nr:hypothetical protein [Tanacetum cinerariifolium]
MPLPHHYHHNIMPTIITTSTTDPPSSPSSTPPRCHHPPISPQPPSHHHLLLATTKGCVSFVEAPPRGNAGKNQASEARVVNTVENAGENQPRAIRCYNCNGESHIAKQYTTKKKVKDSEWLLGLKVILMLLELLFMIEVNTAEWS